MIQQVELKGYSKNTIETYISALINLSDYYKTSPDLLSVDQIREYIHYQLTVKKLSKSWMNQIVGALKILYREILRREWDALGIPRPRREIKLPLVLSKEEVSEIINSPRNLKHKALLMTTYSARLRLHEVCNLKVKDIDSQRMLIRVVQAKGAKDRYTILSPVTLNLLRDYVKMYKVKEWLFETQPHQPMAHRSAQHVFKKALRTMKIKKNCGVFEKTEWLSVLSMSIEISTDSGGELTVMKIGSLTKTDICKSVLQASTIYQFKRQNAN